MTIAAGFRCDAGVVFCADTKHTGTMVLHDPKIFPKEYASQAKSIFTAAGSTAFARMAVRKCESAIEALTHPTLGEMEAEIDRVLLEVYKQHVFPHPDRGLVGGPDFWLLIGLWSPMDGLKTYYTTQTALVPFDTYNCLGSGDYLGHYLIKPQYTGPQTKLNRLIPLACTALFAIKAYDADCGGNSQFILLDNDGWMGKLNQFNITRAEQFSEKFREISGYLFNSIADLHRTGADTDKDFDDFKRVILQFREKYKKEDALFKQLEEALSKGKKASTA